MSSKKPRPKPEKTQASKPMPSEPIKPDSPEAQPQEPEIPNAQSASTKEQPESTATPKFTQLPDLYQHLADQLAALTLTVQQQGDQIAELYTLLARKWKPATNGKVQICDTHTGTIYPSKNNCYQTLLKSGELNDIINQGVFGDNPSKNNFDWFALNRAYPDRFEEIKDEDNAQP